MYMGLYMRFCSQRDTPGRILQVSTNLLQIQTWDKHLASCLQQEMLSLSHGDVFYPSEKHIWSNFPVKKGQEKNETGSSGIQIFLFSALCAIQRHFYSQHSIKNILLKQSAKGCIQFYWETLIFIAVGFTGVKTESWIHDATEADNEMGFGTCMKYRHKLRLRLEDGNPFQPPSLQTQ